MSSSKKYDDETQARAVRMYADRLAEGSVSQRQGRREVGGLLGVKPDTLRTWVRRDMGEGSTPPAEEEVARLRREIAQLRRANDILRTSTLRLSESRHPHADGSFRTSGA